MKAITSAMFEASAAIATFDTALGLMVATPHNDHAHALERARDEALRTLTRLQTCIVDAVDAALTGDLFEGAA